MFRIDKAIYDADSAICKNIDRFDSSERGLLSQNILSQLRNLVEYIAEKVMAGGNDIDPNDYKLKEEAVTFEVSRTVSIFEQISFVTSKIGIALHS